MRAASLFVVAVIIIVVLYECHEMAQVDEMLSKDDPQSHTAKP